MFCASWAHFCHKYTHLCRNYKYIRHFFDLSLQHFYYAKLPVYPFSEVYYLASCIFTDMPKLLFEVG